MEEQNKVSKEDSQKETGIMALDWVRLQYQRFKTLTKKNATDNLWIMGIKLFFQAMMILILIALSPFALFAILLSMMVAG